MVVASRTVQVSIVIFFTVFNFWANFTILTQVDIVISGVSKLVQWKSDPHKISKHRRAAKLVCSVDRNMANNANFTENKLTIVKTTNTIFINN